MEDFNEEASGAFLVPTTFQSQSFRMLTLSESELIRGSGYLDLANNNAPGCNSDVTCCSPEEVAVLEEAESLAGAKIAVKVCPVGPSLNRAWP